MNNKDNVLSGFLQININNYNVLRIINLDFFFESSNAEKVPICPICLNSCNFPSTPDNCGHIYCYRCLKSWSKNKKICPLCRRFFSKILKI